MKLSFSRSVKSSGKAPAVHRSTYKFASAEDLDQSAETKEYLTEFDASKKTLDRSKIIAPIPPLPNSDEWTARKKMKNLDLPVESDDPNNLQFEVDTTLSVDPTDSTISFGLNLRNQCTTKGEDNADVSTGSKLKPKSNIESSMLQKFKEDLRNLPDDRGMEEFDGMSVENFAPALLAGYGWVEGKGIGRNAKEDVKIVEYKRRTAKEGLGFVGELPINGVNKKNDKDQGKEKHKEINKEKENGQSNGNYVVGKEETKGRYYVVGKEETKGRYYVGKDVRVVGGSEVGLKGRIVEVIKGGVFLILRLSRSKEEVTVLARDVADLGSSEEERCLRKLKELKFQGLEKEASGHDRRRGKDSSNIRSGKESNDSKRKRREGDNTRGSPSCPWLNSHIRVRIISKELKRGRLYLQKGEIVDVVSPTTCNISMDNSRELIQGVDQEFLETALPRRGGPVLVLFGRHKGVYGSLVEKDVENETAVVRDADSHEPINVRLEQIAEYIGDPSFIGY